MQEYPPCSTRNPPSNPQVAITDRNLALILVSLCRRVGGPETGRRGEITSFRNALQDQFDISDDEAIRASMDIAGYAYFDTDLPDEP